MANLRRILMAWALTGTVLFVGALAVDFWTANRALKKYRADWDRYQNAVAVYEKRRAEYNANPETSEFPPVLFAIRPEQPATFRDKWSHHRVLYFLSGGAAVFLFATGFAILRHPQTDDSASP